MNNEWQPRVLVTPASAFARHRTLGGGERYAAEFTRALNRVTPAAQGLYDLAARAPGDTDPPEERMRVRHFGLRWGVAITRDAIRTLAGYDVMHVMCFPTPFSDFLMLWGRRRGKWIVLTDVGGGGRCWSSYLRRIHPRFDLHRLAHGLAHLSKYAATFFSDWSHPQTVLYGGAEVAGGPLGDPQGYALFIGRLLPHKGVLEIIEAIGRETPLRVVGRPYDPGYFDRLTDAARGKRISFFTDASDEDLKVHRAGANVILQTSLPAPGGGGDKSELLGLAALEAMGAGKPALVTTTTSLPELVVDGVTGYIVPPGDLAALRDRIERLIRDPSLSAQLGRQAREHVAAHFTWTATANRGLAFYRELRQRKQGRG